MSCWSAGRENHLDLMRPQVALAFGFGVITYNVQLGDHGLMGPSSFCH